MPTLKINAFAGFVAVACLGPTAAHAQGTGAPPPRGADRRTGFSTPQGDTGIWFVPTAEVLLKQKWAISFQNVNIDDGQGFTDITRFPATFAYGLNNRAELVGSWTLVTRIDRDVRPLFFTSGQARSGTGGGLVVDHPLVRDGWIGNRLGDLWVGAKISLVAPGPKPLALALRGQVKLPTGNRDTGASSGKLDGQFDGILSTRRSTADLSGYAGFMVRGNPGGYDLTHGLRWGLGAGFVAPRGLYVSTELFGERYLDDTITAPAGVTAADHSVAPVISRVRGPVVGQIGLTWRAARGFYLGVAASANFNMASRDNASAVPALPVFGGPQWDKAGVQIRIGFHPGASASRSASPPSPPHATAPAPPPPANRPPEVQALCDPCRVEAGRAAVISADAQDPDGDPLTYAWTYGAGTLATSNGRQSLWTAPQQTGPVQFTVTVTDARGGRATSSVTVTVAPPRRAQYALANQARTPEGFPHLTHVPSTRGDASGMFRSVAWVSALIVASHPAAPHHAAMTKPGRPAIAATNSSQVATSVVCSSLNARARARRFA